MRQKKIDLSEKLSIDVFKGLIDRMVNMNVYLYWKSEHVNKYDDMGNTKVNLDLEINYIEWLNKDMSHFGAKDHDN